jgi:hypothetical protein
MCGFLWPEDIDFDVDSGCNSRLAVSSFRHGQVAQSVEQRIENPRVGGSIPPLATIP